MTNISKVIRREMAKSGGKIRVVKVPKERRPTAESLRKLDMEINSQIAANEAMRHRSWINAEKRP